MIAAASRLTDTQRHRLVVRGQVQGVGFRPYVYRLAAELGLGGWVENDGAGVTMEVQGTAARLDAFRHRLHQVPPPAQIATVEQTVLMASEPARSFVIRDSRGGAARCTVAVDSAVCEECLRELFQPGNRRYRYAFIACPRCGPRFSLTRELPFDRAGTSMAAFDLCDDCRREYCAPGDRRFHAQVTACPACGPQLRFLDGDGRECKEPDPLAAALALLHAGCIVAVKGIGGFHLLCDARNAEAVAELRRRKGREAKPLAVMAANAGSVAPFAWVSAVEGRWLESPERPIVLLDKRPGCDAALPGVAPQVAQLGVMLPYAPPHYLLFHGAAGRPCGRDWLDAPQPLLLVCTSANISGEPLLTDDRQVRERLRGLADAFLCHDREIVRRCDDSVLRLDDNTPRFIRRARGFVPRPIPLRTGGASLLALGGDFKNTFCLTRGDQAFVSEHNGDLDNAAARRALEESMRRWLTSLEIKPQAVVHDLHPDFFTTRLAQRLAAEREIPCLAVQHHHAHVASVVAEAGLGVPVLGVALDGFGLGDDGGLWGGELLGLDGAGCRRLGHLRPLAMPGGERAAREPWRLAASALYALGRKDEILRRWPHQGQTLIQLLDRQVNAPLTSSAGRWFDAVAALLGVSAFNRYEGEAAMRLEALARGHGPVAAGPEDYRVEADGSLDLLPLIERLLHSADAAHGAALFHSGLAAALADWVQQTAAREGVRDVVLNGGCFMNALLARDLRTHLTRAGLAVHQARQLPANDGGLSIGQAWIGRARLAAAGHG